MGTFKDLQTELRNKERKIRDLIRFIKTRNDHNPNYSLLLGAGCSITSDIRSANTLISQWKKDIFLQETEQSEEEYTEIEANKFLSNQMWYDSRNPYSALFEKKYDLPRQRRMFVEQEVRDKLPSIGYSYLIKLVENNYFKTLFTTNFDDLLNEAFYQYSTERPLLCAHDSSINSITITSKRPKIIKLHGDYLFDDIKSTLRETESLEDNIKNKFIEFAKDYGLIVIGYGGNDRSIMDILSYLLKNEDYFKHGIYWCLRADSEISEDLRKLLWKDRVYYVQIEGFDELMAELNSKLNKNDIPIDSFFLNEKTENLITKIITNPHLKNTSCTYIKEDFHKLRDTKDQNIVGKFIEYMSELDDEKENEEFGFKLSDNEKLNDDEEKYLLSLQKELYTRRYNKALEMIEERLVGVKIDSRFYKDLLEYKGSCLIRLNKNLEAVECYEKLIKLDPQKSSYYKKVFQLKSSFEEKLDIIEEAIKINKTADLVWEKARLIFSHYNFHYDKNSSKYNLQYIGDCVNECLALDPSIRNPAWNLKFKYIKEKFNNEDDLILEYATTLEELGKQNIEHETYILNNIKLKNLEKKSNSEIYKYLTNSIKKSNAISTIKSLELTLLEQYAKNNDLEKLEERFKFIEEHYTIDDHYLNVKAEYLLKKFDKLDDAISLLESVKKKSYDINENLFALYIFKDELDKAKEIFDAELKDNMDHEITLLESSGKYDEALELSLKQLEKEPFHVDNIVQHSYILLLKGNYEDAYHYLEKKLKASNYTQPYLLINYYIATKHWKNSLKADKVKEKLINLNSTPEIVKAGAYCLIEDENNAFSSLAHSFKEDYSLKYKARKYVVFKPILKKERFKRILGLTD
ncbi:SIR2 family protein [Maribellus sp. CM-23]|uniref:SIR2 family protein n=1 Tax=Maribellus sp. CM-23 TaxID=2781026 RepID=UPI001F1BF061|nr:SIR2 family protein [Maribellus sp. CM-23]MCE4565208.1 SIR2 family protein [Maribellus sp. CM-23]